jgi:hypothetical protein
MNDINSFSEEKQDVLSRIGYGAANAVSTRIISLVDDYIDNYHDFIAPSFSYVYRDIEAVDGYLIDIGDSIIIESRVLARLLQRCEQVAVFALTIGGYLEELVTYLADKGMVLQATVLDAIGSGAAEKLADEIEEEIRHKAAKAGLVISRRFSPGYCDWDIVQQGRLFCLLDSDSTGITLTDSMLMMPRKSISGVIGIGLPGRDIERYNPCIACRKRDCPGRRR